MVKYSRWLLHESHYQVSLSLRVPHTEWLPSVRRKCCSIKCSLSMAVVFFLFQKQNPWVLTNHLDAHLFYTQYSMNGWSAPLFVTSHGRGCICISAYVCGFVSIATMVVMQSSTSCISNTFAKLKEVLFWPVLKLLVNASNIFFSSDQIS